MQNYKIKINTIRQGESLLAVIFCVYIFLAKHLNGHGMYRCFGKIEDLHKTFKNKKDKTEVLKGIDLIRIALFMI